MRFVDLWVVVICVLVVVYCSICWICLVLLGGLLFFVLVIAFFVVCCGLFWQGWMQVAAWWFKCWLFVGGFWV